MWSPGPRGGAAGQNPAASPTILAGEGARKDLGFVRDRLVCGFGAEMAAGEQHGGAGCCDMGRRRGGQPGRHRLGSGVPKHPRGGLGEGNVAGMGSWSSST
jgi:hypothetical protein